MSEHECIIGSLNDDIYKLITLKELKSYIQELKEYNQYILDTFAHDDVRLKFQITEYTLKDYCDKRKSTNLTRFEFCPYCGKKIDWKKIKEENKND